MLYPIWKKISKEGYKVYLFQFLSKVLPQALNIYISSLIIKSCGIDLFGSYVLILSVISITFITFSSAIDTIYLREFSEDKFKFINLSKLIIFIISLPIIYFISLEIRENFLVTVLILISILFQQLIETLLIIYRKQNHDKKVVLPRLIPVISISILILILKPNSLIFLSFIMVISWLSPLVFLYKKQLGSVVVNTNNLLNIFKKSFLIWLTLLFTQVYGNVDTLLIGNLMTTADVANYKIAYTLSSITIPIGAIFSFIYLSKIADYKNNFYLFNKMFRNQLLLMIILGVTLIVGIVLFYPLLNTLLFSGKLKSSYLPTIILSFASLFNLLSMSCIYTLLSLNKDKSILIITILGSVFYILICYMLIPIFGIIGVSITMFSTYLLLFTTYYIIVKKNINKIIIN